MRLIDADELMEHVYRDKLDSRELIAKMVKNAPTVDAVQVIRCKECKYASMTYDGECKYCDIWFPDEAIYIDGDHFCSAAERKEK